MAYGSHSYFYIFLKLMACLNSMYQILISFFEMGDIVYGSYIVEAFSIIDTIFFIYWILSTYLDSKLCIQSN